MAKHIPFTKMEGLGNDYIYINGFDITLEDPAALARAMSDRHFGIGSDGLVLILPSAVADVRMRMFNSDGSEAEMCGNASRCVGKYVYDHGLVKKPVITLETKAGIKVLHLMFEHDTVVGARVDMGEPILSAKNIPVQTDTDLPQANEPVINKMLSVAGQTWKITAVSMGNPHAVVFVDNVATLDLPQLGVAFEQHSFFPQRVNTEFVQILSPSHVRMRVWERGAGETLACGTGACATVVACVLTGQCERRVRVDLLGGALDIEWNEQDNHVLMTGPARTVFDGMYHITG
jgi:diaminopimelate epimerase